MSTITAPSFIDDGISFCRRLPHPPQHHRPAPSSTSAYTGSYIDDGLDLLPPAKGHGFGAVDRKFYRHRRRRHRKGGDDGETGDREVWSKDIARAVTGDVQHSLGRLQELGGIAVRKGPYAGDENGEKSEDDRKKEQKRKGVVLVPIPLKWGVFVIKGDDGRVVVVDEEGEWDSGPVCVVEKKAEEETMCGAKRWVRAASTLSSNTLPLPTDLVRKETTAKTSGAHKSTRRERRKDEKHSPSHHVRPPSPNQEPESDSDSDTDPTDPTDPATLSPLASPTDFLMTGGLSGWPSRTASPEGHSPVVPHAITWDTTAEPRARAKKEETLTKEWTTSSCSRSNSRTSASRRPSSQARPKRSRHSSVSIFEVKNSAPRPSSAYQPPDFVEVIYDETPPGELSYSQSQMGWGGVNVPSVRSLHASREQSEVGAWDAVPTKSSHRTRRKRDMADLGWDASARGTARNSAQDSDWGRSKAGSHADSTAKSVRGWTDSVCSQHIQTPSRAEDWDGYERPKSGSEVSVYGGSVRSQHGSRSRVSRVSQESWPASHHASSHHNYPAHDHHSVHTRVSSRHRNDGRGWEDGKSRSQGASVIHWDSGGEGQTW